MFLVMKLVKWKSVNLEAAKENPFKLPFVISFKELGDGSIGFLEVYDTRENAMKTYSDAQIFEVIETPAGEFIEEERSGPIKALGVRSRRKK